MTPENFCYWLKGFFELQTPTEMRVNQVMTIKDHLDLVFHKITPFYNSMPPTEAGYQILYTAHTGASANGLC